MSRAPSLCGVVLSAGASTRMGRDKALLPWPPAGSVPTPTTQTFLSAAIHSLMPLTDMVIVVAGKNASNLMPLIYAAGAVLVENPEPERGQFSSLQVGLQAVMNHGRDAAIVTLVDRPPVNVATIETLLAEFESAVSQRKWAVVPEYKGKHGHPLVVGREMIGAFLNAPATSTARDVEHHNQQHIAYVAVSDPFVTMNVDTPEEYAALAASTPSENK